MEPTKFDIKYAAIRRTIMEQTFSRMNDRQKEAVFHTEGPLLVLAGAGSGKTTVLIHRIINILRYGRAYQDEYATPGATEDDLKFLAQYMTDPQPENEARADRLCAVFPAKPWEVIAITFTNKAARELQERLRGALGEEDAAGVWAYTFHSACLRILRRDIDKLGYETAFTIYDEDDRKRLIGDILRPLNLDDKIFDARGVISTISRAKDNLLTPKKFAAQAGDDFYKNRVAEIYAVYEKRMRAANALDFDDIIMKTVQLLQSDAETLDYYQNKFRYVLVDEYQDTNHAQNVLITLLAGGHKNICVVGDDDQSIYKFRGATIANILEFEQKFQDAKTIRLEQNYRSTGVILNAANSVIRNNQNRKGKELWTEQEGGSKLHLHRSDTQEGEAAYIAAQILESKSTENRKWSDHAVLYRNNVLSGNIEIAFRRNNIPYRIYKGRDFFSRAEIRDMFAYLWVIENPSDVLRLKRIINMPARKIGDRSIELAEQEAAAQGVSLFDVVANASAYPSLVRSASAMEGFGKMINGLREKRGELSLSDLYDLLLRESGYYTMLLNKPDLESRGRLEHIMELKSNIVEYEAGHEASSLGGFLEEMALYTDADATDEEEDAVLMMTMHAAKGLEFPVVFLCGIEDGLFPGFRAEENPEDMEEERRLCYVALTRAKEELYITCAERRMIYGRTQYARPSRFIKEIPEELIDSNLEERRRESPSAAKQRRQPPDFSAARSFAPLPTEQAFLSIGTPTFAAGDRVRHKAFGEGLVVSVKAMGSDQLLEIAFETKGTKRLMASWAAKFIEKM